VELSEGRTYKFLFIVMWMWTGVPCYCRCFLACFYSIHLDVSWIRVFLYSCYRWASALFLGRLKFFIFYFRFLGHVVVSFLAIGSAVLVFKCRLLVLLLKCEFASPVMV
jgi:hypothetical protein